MKPQYKLSVAVAGNLRDLGVYQDMASAERAAWEFLDERVTATVHMFAKEPNSEPWGIVKIFKGRCAT